MGSVGILETLIITKLSELIPQFDGDGADKKVVGIAKEDFLNYIRVVKRIDGSLDARKEFIQDMINYGTEVKEDLEAFMNLWYGCWKHRVKLIFRDKDLNLDKWQVQAVIHRSGSKLDINEFEALRRPIMEFLIERGEYACTNVMSDQFLKQALRRDGNKLDTPEAKCNFISKTLTNVRKMLLLTGPLVFLNVKKVYRSN